jgi:hypothetical protein
MQSDLRESRNLLQELENVGGNSFPAKELECSQHTSGAGDEHSEVLEVLWTIDALVAGQPVRL